jgi:hypothetical protein
MRLPITLLLFFSTLAVHAQELLPDGVPTHRKPAKNYFGVKLGGLASNFDHAGQSTVPVPGKSTHMSWHAGLSTDLLTRKHYNSRIELSYVTKGANEKFANDKMQIESKNRLRYIQLSVLPVIIKSGLKKVNPYLGLGGYYARRIGITSQWNTGGGWENDMYTVRNLDVKNDFGYSVSVGIYAWRRPFAEIRYEGGLTSISSFQKVRNQALVLSLSI